MPTKEELLKESVELNDAEKFQDVIDLLDDKSLKKFNSAELYTEKARAFYGIKNVDKSFKFVKLAISIDPGYSKAYFIRGNAWSTNKNFDKAIEDFTKAIELNPDYVSSYHNRGVAWYYKREFDKAIEDYNRAIQLNIDEANPYINRGIAWDSKREYDKAIEDFTKAIQLEPNSSMAFQGRGIGWSNKNEYDKAIEDFTKAIQLEPNNADAYNRRGIAWGNKKEYDNAIEDFNKTIQLKPDDVHAYNNRGVVHQQKKEYGKAIEEYNNSIRLNPNYALSFRNLGDVYKELGEFDKAIENYENAIKISPNFYWLKTVIDELKAKGEKIDEIKIPETNKVETSLYFLVNTIDSLNISDVDKSLLKNTGNTFLQTINKIRDYSFADNKDPVVHYTKLKVADLIISQERDPLFRYYNVVYMNDPEEGEIIFNCLNDDEIQNSFNSGMGVQDNNIYLGSFLPAKEKDKKNNHEDELVMWRTYGKDENKNEAAGCSITIMSDFFGKDKHYLHSDMSEKGPGVEKKIEPVSTQALYSVLYFDKRDSSVIDPKNKSLNNLINDLRSTTKSFIALKKTSIVSEEKNIAIDKIVYRFLTEIRYLFKSADYAFENELRVIQYASPQINEKDNLVKIDDNSGQWLPRRLYIESNKPIREYIRKIYLGPKVPNPQTWMYLETIMRLKGYNKMELKISECKFQ